MKKSNWIYKVFLWTFLLSITFSSITNLIAYHAGMIIIFIILILVIIIGMVFDMIGTAVLTTSESAFHAMCSQKIKGAKSAIKLIKNNAKVANICNDVIGDICSIVSGGLGTVLAISLANTTGHSLTLVSIIVAAFISAFTVVGKSIFKEIAIKKSDEIIFKIAQLLIIFK